ncbi:DNA polymerase III subunit theta [Leminorella richardii]|uniref:DNA polymerase III subunit theta n=1 Tax=Leminorella richardii TaxID=158841 RepID=A0A2X4UNG9_9GAMM|nr:DNA polymerase III subunit theta [Leminorella richardii]SQI40393.1 DNA polymerase III subunit theta [Leminorella richardii]
MSHNLAELPPQEREKIDVDLHASGIAYKERYGMPFSYRDIEAVIPKELQAYFKERVEFFRTNPYRLGKLPYSPNEK